MTELAIGTKVRHLLTPEIFLIGTITRVTPEFYKIRVSEVCTAKETEASLYKMWVGKLMTIKKVDVIPITLETVVFNSIDEIARGAVSLMLVGTSKAIEQKLFTNEKELVKHFINQNALWEQFIENAVAYKNAYKERVEQAEPAMKNKW